MTPTDCHKICRRCRGLLSETALDMTTDSNILPYPCVYQGWSITSFLTQIASLLTNYSNNKFMYGINTHTITVPRLM